MVRIDISHNGLAKQKTKQIDSNANNIVILHFIFSLNMKYNDNFVWHLSRLVSIFSETKVDER